MDKKTRDLMFSSKSTVWSTPNDFFRELDRVWHFQLDVCATKRNAKCQRFITQKEDAFRTPWLVNGQPTTCWMNPPYGRREVPCKRNCNKKACRTRGRHCRVYRPGLEDWVKLACDWSVKGCTVVCLLPARTDTEWYHQYCEPLRKHHPERVEFLKGRLTFSGKDPAPFPSLVVVFKPEFVTGLSVAGNNGTFGLVDPSRVQYDEKTGWCISCYGANGEHESNCEFRRKAPISMP